ncbi:MAG: LuxR C-terminal-related transcriptional regulator [Ilumatobacteraceae bacterium]
MLTGRIGLSPTMIGRASALDRLLAVVEQADARCSDLPAIALVAGEAGIGKTRLVRELLAHVGRNVPVFSAAAEPGSLGRPFDLAAQLAPVGQAGSADPAGDARDAIGRAAASRGALVVVEDLHWIDVDGAAFVDDLARQPWPSLAIVGTYRPSDLRRGSPAGDLLLHLQRRNEVENLRLDRLGRNEVAAMMSAIVDAPVSSAAVEAVTRRSGGVPFVVEELMRFADADVCSSDVFEVQLPWSLEEAVRQQLADLTPGERVIIDALAVFGQPAGFEVLTSITGLDEDVLIDQLRGLVARGVIVEPREDRLWFGHALVADSVLHQLLGRERRRLHERCFETLSRVAPDAHTGLAHHAQGAGRFDEIVAIAVRGARDYLDSGASFQALRLACDGLAEDGDRIELREVATQAAWRLDFLAEALEHAHRWLELAPPGRSRIDALHYVSRLHLELTDEVASDAVVDQLIAEAEALEAAGSIADLARAEAAIAQMRMLARHPDAVPWAERAIGHATIAGERRIAVQAMVERASALVLRLDRAATRAALIEAIEAAAPLGDGVLLSRAINNMMELLAPGSDEARRMRQRLRETATASGFDKLGSQQAAFWDAMAAHAEGDLASYRRLLDLWRSLRPTPHEEPMYRIATASLHAEEGRVADARAAVSAIDRVTSCDVSADKEYVTALLDLSVAGLARDRDAGRDAFERIIGGQEPHDEWSVMSEMVDAVSAAVAVDIPPAEIRQRLFAGLLAAHPARESIVRRGEGLVLLAEQRHDEAASALRAGLDGADDDLRRPIIGTLLVALAQALQATGDRSGAQRAAESALEALARWPGWRRDRAEALAERLAGTTLRPAGELTARESEVAALIAEGLTNGQLAERLFISPKTAAVHVSNILAKLGLGSRAEVAAWEIRRQLPVAGA